MGKPWANLFRPDALSGLQMVQLIRYGALFAIGIVLAKSGLSAESIGNYESVLLLTGALTFFWVTGIIQSLLPLFSNSKSFRKDPLDSRSPELFNAFALLVLFALLASGLILLTGSWLSGFMKEGLNSDLVIYISLFVLFQSPASLVEYIYLLEQKGRQLIRFGWIAFGIQFIAVSGAALVGLEIQGVLTALVGSALIRFVWAIFILRKFSVFRLSWAYFKEHLSLGFPIMVSILLSGSAQYVDGLIVTAYFDPQVLAVFRYGARELPLVALLAHALSNALIPEITQNGLVAGLRALRQKTLGLLRWLFPVSAALMVFSHLLFPLVYDDRFLESATIFNIYLLVIGTRLLFPQTILIALKKTRFLMLASGFELILNIGLSLFLVQLVGIRGVAYATLLAYLFERIFLMVYVNKILGIPVSQYTPIRPHLVWSLLLLLVFLFTELFLAGFINQLFL